MGGGLNLMHAELDAVADAYWSFQAHRSPTTALLVGDDTTADLMEDFSRGAEDDAIARLEGFADRAEAIDPADLTADDRVTRDVLIEEARCEALELQSRFAEFAVDHVGGFHVTLLQLAPHLTATSPETADALVTKWSRVGAALDSATKRLRQGVATGRTPPRLAVARTIAQIDDYLASPVEGDPFTRSAPPAGFDTATTAAWRKSLTDQVTTSIRPAYAAYAAALRDEILPHARPEERSGLRWLPDGEAAYAAALRRHTSLELVPYDVHQLGLDEIRRLEDEYRRLVGGDAAAIYERLRSDPALRFTSSAEIIDAAQSAMDRAAAALPRWFGTVPSTRCVVAEIAAGAEDSTLAYYLAPSSDGSRPGTYFVNTSEPTTRTRFESEALAFHESIPGHHLQASVALELPDLPAFRRHAAANAYVEGWALYTERLADEMGLYSDDVARLGILSFDSWRSGRLVVDTGIHALGWSRGDAIEWLIANSPQARNNVANEVDRYIGWPGQATAYKIGQREFLRLRRLAESTLGAGFDLRAFHDLVLGSGPVPLNVLDRLVTTWIDR